MPGILSEAADILKGTHVETARKAREGAEIAHMGVKDKLSKLVNANQDSVRGGISAHTHKRYPYLEGAEKELGEEAAKARAAHSKERAKTWGARGALGAAVLAPPAAYAAHKMTQHDNEPRHIVQKEASSLATKLASFFVKEAVYDASGNRIVTPVPAAGVSQTRAAGLHEITPQPQIQVPPPSAEAQAAHAARVQQQAAAAQKTRANVEALRAKSGLPPQAAPPAAQVVPAAPTVADAAARTPAPAQSAFVHVQPQSGPAQAAAPAYASPAQGAPQHTPPATPHPEPRIPGGAAPEAEAAGKGLWHGAQQMGESALKHIGENKGMYAAGGAAGAGVLGVGALAHHFLKRPQQKAASAPDEDAVRRSHAKYEIAGLGALAVPTAAGLAAAAHVPGAATAEHYLDKGIGKHLIEAGGLGLLAKPSVDDLRAKKPETPKVADGAYISSTDRAVWRKRCEEAGSCEASLASDAQGVYCRTHRARSRSYKNVGDIPLGVIRQIGSTG